MRNGHHNMDKKRAQQAFEQLRKSFFPHWDRKRLWKLSIDRSLPSHGICDSEHKKITLPRIYEDTEELQLTLIHEMCHACNNMTHGVPWQRRMASVALRADGIGLPTLANKLREQVHMYQSLPKEDGVYEMLEDIFVNGAPLNLSLDDAIRYVAGECGTYPNELRKYHPRCKTIFLKARKRAIEQKVYRK